MTTLRDLLTIFLKDAQILELKLISKEMDEEEKKVEEENLVDDLLENFKDRMIG